MTTQLTQTQRDLLIAAAAADDAGLAIEGAADLRAAKTLIKRGLSISLPPKYGSSRIAATEAGRATLAVGVPAPEGPVTDTIQVEPSRQEPAPEAPHTPKGKLGELVALLRRPQGAGIDEMMATTGWQAHSVRGAMSGALKKKLGLAVTSEKTDEGRVYRIAADEVV